MINQVVPNSVQNRTFSDFNQPKNGWYLSTSKEKESHKLGMKIAAGAMFAGFGILALMKGALHKTANKYLEKLKFKLEEKVAKGGSLKNFYRQSAKYVSSFVQKSESINNITSLKDVLFQKFMFGKNGEKRFTRKIHETITNAFNRISRNTVNSSYAKTHKKFANLNEYMTALNSKILQEHPEYAKEIAAINRRILRVNSGLEKGFGINARNRRQEKLEKVTEGLFDHFWNLSFSDTKNFRSKKMWQTFIAEDYMLPYKMKTSNEVELLRQAITHDILDSCKAAVKVLDNVQKSVNANDVQSNEILAILRNNISKYKKLSGDNETLKRVTLNKEILDNLQKLSETFNKNASKYNYSEEAVTSMSNYVREVEEIISKNSKGELQEILTAYKKILPRKDYLRLRRHVMKAVKSLDKSIEIETVQYVDKARDLKLGSAPTDIISIIGTVGIVGWFLGKSKDKDQRISSSLRYGIPAIGAIATTLYGTARLVSGGKSMALGLISGKIMNIIGEKVDDTRKKYSLDVSLQNKTIIKPQPDTV